MKGGNHKPGMASAPTTSNHHGFDSPRRPQASKANPKQKAVYARAQQGTNTQ